jgi:hypothetical protein
LAIHHHQLVVLEIQLLKYLQQVHGDWLALPVLQLESHLQSQLKMLRHQRHLLPEL